jgi:alpha-ketoglutarate-dependent taurine dioxygenase
MTDVLDPQAAPQMPRPFRIGPFPVKAGPHGHLAAEADRLAALRWEHFDVSRLAPSIGAEISGIDLNSDLAEPVVEEIRRALFEYKVIFFRDQPFTAEGHRRFAGRFGELELHPFIPSNTGEPELVRFEKGPAFSGYENAWHHDVTWRERPSMAAVLHAVHVPELGGDTLFADMYAAYDSLDSELKDRIDNMTAVHDFVRTFGSAMSADQLAAMKERYPAVTHPVVCTHPWTGRPHLYVNRAFTDHIEGLGPEESNELIDLLCRQADYPEHQCRFHWTPDAIAIWDNRAVQHYAVSDYWPQRRVMERASVVGPRPFRSRPS